MGYGDDGCGDADGLETGSEMQILGGGCELDAGWHGCSSLAVDLERLHLLRLQIWWKCFGTGAQRDRRPDLDP